MGKIPDSFDIIFCPVSNVYIENLDNMYSEAYRVLRKGGLLMIGYMNPWIYMYDGDEVWDQPEKELLLKYYKLKFPRYFPFFLCIFLVNISRNRRRTNKYGLINI